MSIRLDIGKHNEQTAKRIVDLLVQQGVRFFVVAPGSRSTSLAIAIAEHPDAHSVVHFDERGAGFHALGYAKSSHMPAAVLVTSGTAVGNLFPAVMEASLAQIPLIVITADRPQELRGNGSNQTADQVKIFGDYVRFQVEIACSDPLTPEAYYSTIVSHAIFQSTHAPKGPIQLNCCFREPLVASAPASFIASTSTCYEPHETLPPLSVFAKWGKLLSSREKGVIIVGGNAGVSDQALLLQLAEKLGWPIFADILSGVRSDHSHLIPYYDLILKTTKEASVDTVLHFGDRLVSKTLLEWLSACQPSLYLLAAPHPVCHDPKHQVTHRMVCDASRCASLLLEHVAPSDCRSFETWRTRAGEIQSSLEETFAGMETLTEPGLAHSLVHHLPDDWALFLPASMPIRDVDTFFFSKKSRKLTRLRKPRRLWH